MVDGCEKRIDEIVEHIGKCLICIATVDEGEVIKEDTMLIVNKVNEIISRFQ